MTEPDVPLQPAGVRFAILVPPGLWTSFFFYVPFRTFPLVSKFLP